MPSPERDAIAIPIRAENTASGTQPLYQGVGDQNVIAGSHGTQHNHNIRLQNVFNIERVDQLIQGGKDGSHELKEPSRAAIIDWLMLQSTLDFLDHHRLLRTDLVPGTGMWVLREKEFEAWKNASSPSRLLWMHGILGSGKTMLATRIINSLEKECSQNDDVACVYVYFQDGGDQPISADIFICLLKQLLQQQRSDGVIAEELKTKYKYWCNQKIFPDKTTTDEYLDVFKAQVATFKTVYLIVDAFDNYQNSTSEKTQGKLQEAIEQLPSNVRVLITSRRSWHAPWNLGPCQELRVVPHDNDIEKYVNDQIEKDKAMKQKIKEASDPNLQQTITSEITKSTREMFLLARLQVAYLCKQGTAGDIKRALLKLPDSIADVFEASIRKVAESDGFPRRLAQHVLTWVIYAMTPLSVEQIRHSFAIQNGQEVFNPDDLPAEVDLMSACAGLVVMDSEAKILRLVHESVQERLRKHRLIPEQVDVDMAKKCLTYLLFDEASDRGEDRPLLSYAATHWIDHLHRGRTEDDAQVTALALKFLKDSAKVTNAFQTMAGADGGSAFGGITGLHVAAYFNLELSWAECLIQEDISVDAQCSDDQTALHWAAKHGRTALAELLLRNSANPDLQDRNNDTPLHVAVMWSMVDSTGVVQELAKSGARSDIRGGKGLTPLQWAIRYGPPRIAKVLVESQPDVNAEDEHGWTSLREAMDYGQYAIVDLLLGRGADPNRASIADGWTPLRHAVVKGDLPMVRLLVEKKANVNLRDRDNGYSPLRWAVFYQHTRLAELLIRHDADVNDKAKDGSTPLIAAVKSQQQTMAWILLENGARSDDRDGSGLTALHHAIVKRERSIIWLLVTRNAALIPIRDGSGLTALDWAVENDDLSLAWLLCANGAKADAADGRGITALHRASRLGCREIVRFFLDGGTGADLCDGSGLTALHHAALHGRERVVALLASRGAELDIKDARGSTALVLAILGKKRETVQVLLDKGASSDVQDSYGLPALHRTVNDGDTDMIVLLGEGGADLNVRDSHGRTALMFAAQLGGKLAVRRLLEGGANVHLQDAGGRTAWDYAGTNRDVSRLLKDAVRGRRETGTAFGQDI